MAFGRGSALLTRAEWKKARAQAHIDVQAFAANVKVIAKSQIAARKPGLPRVREYFRDAPHAFEHCASVIARFMIPDITTLDVTRPSRDGGRDAIGQLRVGAGPSGILMDFALEAKCYSATNSVGVREMSRLIFRLRHRQFGVLVTTSWVDLQAYKEIKEDQHPIVVVSAADIVDLLHRNGKGSAGVVANWLAEEFPKSV